MNKNKKEDGLPDIAEMLSQKKPFVIVGMIAALVIMASMFWFQKTDQPKLHPIEETYTVANSPPIEVKQSEQDVSTAQPVANVEAPTPPPVSAEVLQQQITLIQEKQKALQQRLVAPLMLVNTNQTV